MVFLTLHPSSNRGRAALKRHAMLDRLAAACESIVREWHVRQSMRTIEAMDPHMLVDLGISPGGIEDAVRHGR